jgi:hypothetical protein
MNFSKSVLSPITMEKMLYQLLKESALHKDEDGMVFLLHMAAFSKDICSKRSASLGSNLVLTKEGLENHFMN